jgi:hypothetical protein
VYVNKKGTVTYLNSGDWIENLTALEYENEEWKLVYYKELVLKESNEIENDVEISPSQTIAELQFQFMNHKKLSLV